MGQKLNFQFHNLLHEIRTSNGRKILPETQTGLHAELHSTSATAEDRPLRREAGLYNTRYVASLTQHENSTVLSVSGYATPVLICKNT